jgi:hypothetical protein
MKIKVHYKRFSKVRIRDLRIMNKHHVKSQLTLDLCLMIFSGVIATLVAFWRFGLKNINPSNPIVYSSDNLFYANLVKNAQAGGVFDGNTLGGSLGQQFQLSTFGASYWAPTWIASHVASAKEGPWLAMFVWWILSYALTGASAYLAFRWLRIGRSIAILGSISFSLIPLHGLPFLIQLPFSAIYLVPPYISIVLLILQGKGFSALLPKSTNLSIKTRERLGISLIGVLFLLGLTSENYYLIFSLQTSFSCVILLLSRRKWWTRAGRMMLVFAINLVALFVRFSPILYSRITSGLNPTSDIGTSDRRAYGAYANGGDPLGLLLPFKDGFFYNLLAKIPSIGDFFWERDNDSTLGNYAGVQAGISFPLLVVLACLVLLGFGARSTIFKKSDGFTKLQTSVLILLSILTLWYSRGGLGTFFSFILPQARQYLLVVVFITCASIMTIGIFATKKLYAKPVFNRIAAVCMCLVLLDSVSSNKLISQIDSNQAVKVQTISNIELPITQSDGFGLSFKEIGYNSIKDLTQFANSALPEGCTILEFPLLQFPVDFGLGVISFRGFEQLKPGLQNTSQKWSAGGITGTPNNKFIDEWLNTSSAGIDDDFVEAIKSSGYCGILYWGNIQEVSYKAGPLNGSRFLVSPEETFSKLEKEYQAPCWKNEFANVNLFCISKK